MCTCFSMCVHLQKDVRKACSLKSIRYWSQFYLMFIKKNAPGFCFSVLNLLAVKGLATWHFCTPSIYCEHHLQQLLYNYLQYVYILPCLFCQIMISIKAGPSVACNKIVQNSFHTKHIKPMINLTLFTYRTCSCVKFSNEMSSQVLSDIHRDIYLTEVLV